MQALFRVNSVLPNRSTITTRTPSKEQTGQFTGTNTPGSVVSSSCATKPCTLYPVEGHLNRKVGMWAPSIWFLKHQLPTNT